MKKIIEKEISSEAVTASYAKKIIENKNEEKIK